MSSSSDYEEHVGPNHSSIRQRIIALLMEHRWTPGFEFNDYTKTGTMDGLRFVRYLRAEGWDIRKRKKKGSNAWEYKLIGDSPTPHPSTPPRNHGVKREVKRGVQRNKNDEYVKRYMGIR